MMAKPPRPRGSGSGIGRRLRPLVAIAAVAVLVGIGARQVQSGSLDSVRAGIARFGQTVPAGSQLLLPLVQKVASSVILAGCPVLPADNIWNARVDNLPVTADSTTLVGSIGATRGVHADFGAGLYDGGPIGIPYVTVGAGQAPVAVSFEYADESDAGPYPIPPNPPIEGGAQSSGDRHILILDRSSCKLYELYAAYPRSDGTWQAGSGAIFDLNSNALRPDTWTSADAAGLPILPGLARYDEVGAGAIQHALRFTAPSTRNRHLWPARHDAGTNNAALPEMGQRFRLRASFDISPYPVDVRVILTALKTYGIILADNGSGWFISGVPDERWDNDNLHLLGNVRGSDFEAVDSSSLMAYPNSGQVR
jgi:hypothetical protein